MRAKYNATKVEYNGIKFDSKLECNIYKVLKEELIDPFTKREEFTIQLQVPYTLQDKFKFNGKVIRPITYRADFVIHKRDLVMDAIYRRVAIIDAKGMETNEFKLKKKLFMKKFNYEITILNSMKQAKEWCQEIIKKYDSEIMK